MATDESQQPAAEIGAAVRHIAETQSGAADTALTTDGDDGITRKFKKRTLTNPYNTNPQWLQDAHAELDAAVAAAYCWPADISDEDAFAALMKLNQPVADGDLKGCVISAAEP